MKRNLLLLFFAFLCFNLTKAQDTFSHNGINYIVIDPINYKVAVYNNSGFSGDANIPATVLYNASTYAVTIIGDNAFMNAGNLTSVSIPETVIGIGPNAFYACNGLTSIIIPNSVTNIDSHAFALCNNIISVTIPNSLISIANYVFGGCHSLVSFTINQETPLNLTTEVFHGITLSKVNLIVPAGAQTNYNNSPVWTEFNIFAPTDIALAPAVINENVAANAVVGALSSTDVDGVNTFTYTLVPGAGSTHNAAFTINGSSLKITNSPDFEMQNSYSIRVRTTDNGGLFYEKQFTITINDLEELPRGCWKKVSTGGYHTLAIAQDGTLWSWGDNDYMQLGNGVSGDKTNPTQISNIGNWASVAAGEYYSLAIKTDGTLWAWGQNTFGQIGNNTTTQQNIPVQIGTATNWKTISAGYSHSIATKTDGTLWAWGRNTYGQLGNNTTTQQNTPVQIGTDTNWSSVKLGRNHTLALKTSGQLWAWGRATFGQLGTGNTTQQNAPIQIGTATDWSEIQAGENNSLAIKTTGTLWSWGDNISGQLGTGNTTQQNAPVQIGTDTNWSKIAAGSFNGYALKTTGTLWSWGDNYFGQDGNGNFTQQNSPVQVGAATDWYSIAAGNYYGIAQKSTGTFLSWGDNQAGQLGNGSTTPNTTGVNAPGSMGCSGNVLAFDGVDDKIEIVSAGTGFLGDNSANEDYSIQIKVKFNNVTSNKIFDKSNISSGDQGMRIGTDSNGKLFFDQAYGGIFSRVQTTSSLLPNIWYVITATFDYANKTHKLYLNGDLIGIKSESNTPVFVTLNITLGSDITAEALKAIINELAIFSGVVLPENIIIANANSRNSQSQLNVQATGLTAHFKMNQGNANANNAGLITLYNEVVGSPNTATLVNFALAGPTSNWSYDNTASDAVLGTKDVTVTNNVKIYPNPSTGIFTISLEEEANVSVHDMLGKVIYTNKVKAGNNSIDISNYQSGVYLLNVKTENGSLTKKIIKE
jgi:alpha-tubulin suppressor-like RCC1 family protein